jgi:hypothetical protein
VRITPEPKEMQLNSILFSTLWASMWYQKIKKYVVPLFANTVIIGLPRAVVNSGLRPEPPPLPRKLLGLVLANSSYINLAMSLIDKAVNCPGGRGHTKSGEVKPLQPN